ncbi:GDSL esterase/lipase At2g30310-like [Mangifera indica]|uniref:GDSL esterase/lipase At2g30310-like n=1 Tax=Mangifera indica TaxID=29780 RepID=UPI001CFA4ECC|nr:GDSL esterase/lipase At2g30310-like [Mangifera indica]
MIIFLHILILYMIMDTSNSREKLPTILVFGDSTVDTGNNNYIQTVFKGNFLPYGEDFPGKIPTGRFSDGKLVPDFLAKFLGIKDTVPPFLDPTLSENELVSGVCFASAGSGFDDLTSAVSKVIPVSKQIDMFRDYIRRVKEIVGDEEKVKKIISSALIVISAGTNDFIFNFYDIPTRKLEFNVSGYQDFLLNRLQSFIKELYELGCRKMAIAGLPPIGCLPLQMTAKFEDPIARICLQDQNTDAQAYNYKLAKLLPQLQSLLPKSKIVYADIYQPLIEMIDHPQKYGFVETKRGCCGSGVLEAAFLCNPLTPTCARPEEFLFWDSIHPTQSAYKLISEHLEIEVYSKLINL